MLPKRTPGRSFGIVGSNEVDDWNDALQLQRTMSEMLQKSACSSPGTETEENWPELAAELTMQGVEVLADSPPAAAPPTSTPINARWPPEANGAREKSITPARISESFCRDKRKRKPALEDESDALESTFQRTAAADRLKSIFGPSTDSTSPQNFKQRPSLKHLKRRLQWDVGPGQPRAPPTSGSGLLASSSNTQYA